MTRPQRGLSLVLPPGWVHIPLQDKRGATQVIDRLVAATGLDDGSGAQLRRQLKKQIHQMVDDTAAIGAVIFAISTSGVNGVPLPASLVVTAVDIGIKERAEPWWSGAFATLGAPNTGDDDQAILPIERVARRVSRNPVPPEMPSSVRVDYWVVPTEDNGAYHCVMATPLVSHEGAMLDLFDTVISTARVTRQL